MSYATFDQLQAYSSDALDSVLATAVLARASDIVRHELRRLLNDPSFEFAAYAAATPRLIHGYPVKELKLSPHQMGSVTIVEHYNGATFAVEPADCWMELPSGSLLACSLAGSYGQYWASIWGEPALWRVTAQWGYGAVPPSVVEVTLELAMNVYRARATGGIVEMVGAQGGGATRIVSGLSKPQLAILQSLVNQWYGYDDN